MEWLEEIDEARRKSKNLQGGINGLMKDRFRCIKEAFQCVVKKAEDKGDPIFYQMQLREANMKLKRKEEEELAWRKERNLKIREIQELSKINERLEDQVWKYSRGIYEGDDRRVIGFPPAEEVIDRKARQTPRGDKDRNSPLTRLTTSNVRIMSKSLTSDEERHCPGEIQMEEDYNKNDTYLDDSAESLKSGSGEARPCTMYLLDRTCGVTRGGLLTTQFRHWYSTRSDLFI